MNVRTVFLSVLLLSGLSVGSGERDSLLAILCPPYPLIGTHSPECISYFESQTPMPSNQTLIDVIANIPTIPPLAHKTVKAAKILGSWAQAILGLVSSLITIYTAIAVCLKCRNHSTRSALTLGISTDRSDPHQHDIELGALPKLTKKATVSTL